MDKIEKLFRKITKKERIILKEHIELLATGKINNFDVKKIKQSNFYRLRAGSFRIIFHYDDNEIIIDDIRPRNEKTYKNLSK